MTKWYQFSQNNSGGIFILDANLSINVYIEAHSPQEANQRAEELGIYFYGVGEGMDCPCCGDRWYSADAYNALSEEDLKESIKVHEENSLHQAWSNDSPCRIHPLGE